MSAATRFMAGLILIGAGILLSAGFFTSMPAPAAAAPNGMIALIYAGTALLAVSVLALGIGLLRKRG
jgi:hypothetical protein